LEVAIKKALLRTIFLSRILIRGPTSNREFNIMINVTQLAQAVEEVGVLGKSFGKITLL
jgi:hypothetical protein